MFQLPRVTEIPQRNIHMKAGFRPEKLGEPKGQSVENGRRDACSKAESWIRQSEYNCCTIESNNLVKFWEATEPLVKLQKADKDIIFMYSSAITVEIRKKKTKVNCRSS